MFSQSRIKKEDRILQCLAHTYRCYGHNEWHYPTDAGVGGYIIDACIGDNEILMNIATAIGGGLLKNKPNAEAATKIFDMLYKQGFKNGLFKDRIQYQFKTILKEIGLPEPDENLNMAECLKSIYACKMVDSLFASWMFEGDELHIPKNPNMGERYFSV